VQRCSVFRIKTSIFVKIYNPTLFWAVQKKYGPAA